jgi:hypothetical protein
VGQPGHAAWRFVRLHLSFYTRAVKRLKQLAAPGRLRGDLEAVERDLDRVHIALFYSRVSGAGHHVDPPPPAAVAVIPATRSRLAPNRLLRTLKPDGR